VPGLGAAGSSIASSVLAFAAAALALVLTALLASASLRPRSSVSFALAAYLFAAAEVVALTEVLSLLDAVTVGGYLAGEGLLLAVAAAAWVRLGRPRPVLPSLGAEALRRHPVVTVLGLVVTLGLVYQAAVALATPPNEWDALVYHLSRAAAWYQGEAVAYIEPAPTERLNVYPPNAEILTLFTFTFLGSDALAGLVQPLTELALLVALYGIGRRLGYRRPAALFASLLFATLAQVALESVVTKNNLVVASFVGATAYFLLGRERRELPLAGLAVALALGTKLTAFFALPVLALMALLLLPVRRVAELAAWSALAFAAVGAYGYALNLAETGTPFPSTEEVTEHRPDPTAGGTISSFARVYYDFVDFSGLNPPAAVRDAVESTGRRLFDLLGIAANPEESTARRFTFEPNAAAAEYRSYFGPLGFLLVVPLSLGFCFAWARRRIGRDLALVALALPLYTLALVLLVRYSPLLCRFMLTPVALTMPLAAWAYRYRRLAATLAAVGAVTLVAVHALDFAKPVGLRGDPVVWTLTRPEAQALYDARMRPVLEVLENGLPATARIGAALDTNDWSYPLYGPELERRVVFLPLDEPLRQAERLGLPLVLLGDVEKPRTPTPGWSTRRLGRSGWVLARRLAASAS
jgi:Glycosyltransferase family 87